MFTEPVPRTPHLVTAGPRLTDSTCQSQACLLPACSLILVEDCHHRMGHQAPQLLGWFQSQGGHFRGEAKDRGEMTLHICPQHPPLWGSTASFPDSLAQVWAACLQPLLLASLLPSSASSQSWSQHGSQPWDTTPSPNHPSTRGVDKTWPLSQTQPKASLLLIKFYWQPHLIRHCPWLLSHQNCRVMSSNRGAMGPRAENILCMVLNG